MAKIGDEVITTSIILKALQELQAESEEKFCCFPMVKKYVKKNPNTVANVFGYAESPCLSLMKSGGIIEALDLTDVQVPMMTHQVVERVIEICFWCMDMGELPDPKLSKNQKKIWAEMT